MAMCFAWGCNKACGKAFSFKKDLYFYIFLSIMSSEWKVYIGSF